MMARAHMLYGGPMRWTRRTEIDMKCSSCLRQIVLQRTAAVQICNNDRTRVHIVHDSTYVTYEKRRSCPVGL